MRLLTNRGRKAAAATVTLSLLLQQGRFLSQAAAGIVVSAPVEANAPVGRGVPGAAPSAVSLTSPLSPSAVSLTPSLGLPGVTTVQPAPAVGPKAAAVLPRAAAAATTAAAPQAVPASPAAAVQSAQAAAEDAQLLLPAAAAAPRSAETMKTKPAGTAAGLEALGKALKGAAAPSLRDFFDGTRRSQGNGIAETAGETPAFGAKAGPAQAMLGPASEGSAVPAEAAVPAPAARRSFIAFNVQYLKDIKKLFLESATKPNKQDYIYLLTKTFGLNLAIRAAFAISGVHGGQLPLERAILTTAWYQVQDAVFTVFGQTYMKFLGKMTGLLRIGKAQLGDLFFVYFQLVAFEFINRLVLGPIGENPLVYSLGGIGLLLLNNLQGMVSGGLLIPVINKLRAANLISERTSNNLYQLASLTMHLGLLATFGFQSVFTALTTALMIVSWTAYIALSFFVKGKPMPAGKL